MTALFWAAVCALSVAVRLGFTAVALGRERHTRGRGAVLLRASSAPRRRLPDRARLAALARPWAAPAGALITLAVLVEGVPGLALGVSVAWGVRRRLRSRPPGAAARESPPDDPRLPLAADLLAACLSAGAAPHEAAEAVGDSLGGPVGERLLRACAAVRLGGEPGSAWGAVAGLPGAAELARCLARAHASGAPAAEPVARVAVRLRADRARAAAARARRAQVLITAPVGLCFLPAFLAVGVAPVVIGLADGLLNGG
ncbi:type II secretion system F family protein [Streptomyces clavuligerus]|uniref:Integral membrane protein n=1 Tax=Streptomyces clavuligerus TaxID=1901 RepID=E2Q9P1_STRCL|nr:type II secretion system F family protein [Streptomyces clavuligerus]ANW21963.1 type II secretion protein F [Streptomyces clavuligerus]AXU16589.1 type II secretion protein F [Streptomyces clavuligerus]EFG07618.1 Integral membrane protein [Streptomyces clavuligerus]MBY6304172.1 type II secretion system F family protein [Streptomyces clavuligerus]QCS09354.1 type II secretion protein F [Streptomyces clavuligerus]